MSGKDIVVEWQAHRGGGGFEMPDNTMASINYGWGLGGIPEVDIRTTLDGVVICFHDETPGRTTNAPERTRSRRISELAWAELKDLDAGEKFDKRHKGERIPLFEDVLRELARDRRKMIYADLKRLDCSAAFRLIARHNAAGQIIIAAPDTESCRRFKREFAEIKTMQWIGGTADQIMEKFERAAGEDFQGLDIVQLHLNDIDGRAPGSWRYQIGKEFVLRAAGKAAAMGVGLEVLPWLFDEENLLELLDMGVRRFATDEPARFVRTVEKWRGEQG